MAVEFNITRSSLHKYIGQFGKQIPFSLAQAVTDLAYSTRDKWHAEAAKRFESPVALTKKFAYVYKTADKKNLRAIVGAKDFIAKGTAPNKYLMPQVYGGPRYSKRSENALKAMGLMNPTDYMIPSKAIRDGHGNIRKGLMTKILSDLRAFNMAGADMNRNASKAAKYFVVKDQTGSLKPGVYEKMSKGKIRRVLIFINKVPQYTVKFPMYDIAHHHIRKNFATTFSTRFLKNIGVTRSNYLRQFAAERRAMQAQTNYFRPGASLVIR